MKRLVDLLEFYSISRTIVRAWPATYPSDEMGEARHQRLNTFAVVRSLSDLNADNFKKTVEYAGRNMFFSRDFDASGHQPDTLKRIYPAFLVREEDFVLNDPVDAGSGRRQTFHNLVLMLADKLPNRENNFEDPFASSRMIEQVGNDLRVKMAQLLLVFGRWVYAQGILSNAVVFQGWYDRTHLEQLKTAGVVIDRYIIDDSLAGYVSGVKPAQGEVFYETGTDNLVVCTLRITIETASCHDLPDFDYGALGDEYFIHQNDLKC